MSLLCSYILLVVACILAPSAWADTGEVITEDEATTIADILNEFVQGVKGKDLKRIMSVFASTYSDSNYENCPPWPMYEPFESKEALRKGFQGVLGQMDVFYEFSEPTLEFVNGKAVGHVWVRERYGRNRNFEGRKRFEFVKENGHWKISRWEWDDLTDPENAQSASLLTKEGRALLAKGNKQGVVILRRVVDEYPHHAAEAQLAIADHFFLENDFETALHEYHRVLEIWDRGGPRGPSEAQLARKQIDCIGHFLPNRSALETLARAKALEATGEKQQAVEAYNILLSSYPDAPHAAAWLLAVFYLSDQEPELIADLVGRFPYSAEAEQYIYKLEPRPELALELAEKYPDAPWAALVREKAEEKANAKKRQDELPAVKEAVDAYLTSLEMFDHIATFESVSEAYLALPWGAQRSSQSYKDVKQNAQRGAYLSNVRQPIIRAEERYAIHPNCEHALTFIVGKRITDIFKNGFGFREDAHDYVTVSLALRKEGNAWKVASAVFNEAVLPRKWSERADEEEKKLLRQWEADVEGLEKRERQARILLAIADRYKALKAKQEAARVRKRVKSQYAETHIAKRMLVFKEDKHFYIEYNIPEGYADAILRLCETAYRGYKDIYGIDLLEDYPDPKIKVTARFGSKLSLWVSPDSNPDIGLVTPSIERLGPPRDAGGKGAHHVYGFAHEMGHIAIGFHEKGGAWTQGIAHYIGSQLLPYVEKELGEDAWPIAYDYVSIEGPARLMKGIDTAQAGTQDAACKVLYEIEKKHGPKTIGMALRKTKELGHTSTMGGVKLYPVENFKSALIEITDDASINTLFRENGF